MTRNEALEILKLSTNPSKDDIEKAYRTQAAKYHPDKFARESEVIREVMNEKMKKVNEAKAVLLNEDNSSSSQGSSASPSAIQTVQTFIGRRQFSEALQALNRIIQSEGESPALLFMKAEIQVESNNHYEAYQTLMKVAAQSNTQESDPDFHHFTSICASGAGLHAAAHTHIDKALNLTNGSVPIYLATKATIFINQGKTKEADLVINRLAEVDPHHPLVQQRGEVFNMGGTYVGKQDAQQTGCLICVILELIFDCC
jgi:predicted Zn-dependent protease